MEYKTYECPYCKKYTRHEEMTYREVSAIEKDSEAEQMINGINDYIGARKLVGGITGRKYWKCCECGYAALRATSGKIIRVVINRDHPAWMEAIYNFLHGKKSGF